MLKKIAVILTVITVTVQTGNETQKEIKDAELEEVYGGFLKPRIISPFQDNQKIILWDEKGSLPDGKNKNY
ncbi:hypothetical protein SAMN06265182_0160 [Persephonella hydrogeniphila]|uniref:Uncharacterized protein n=1 Tax=Persephonella hydrogeniphila TaxID=198703 RepID=A0A285N1D3_9AQUI|nr:hypothetical protein [Persephonella hydrogeniphila]SNZ02597.1 hypothetical protein SAMN06265182_0160 [Persephonella hydrogeniphila]